MPELVFPPYSWREDPAVPEFRTCSFDVYTCVPAKAGTQTGLPPSREHKKGTQLNYAGDTSVPDCGDRPLFVFDGVCVLCSGGAAFIMRHDHAGRIDMASAQGALGAALYRHYGLAMDDTYLFLKGGRAFTKSAGYLELFSVLGGWWRLFGAIGILPETFRDWLYDRVAANRYRWFGKADYCALLTDEQRARLIG